MAYNSDNPQVKAGKASGVARRQRAKERHEREARHARLRANPGVPGHPWLCICRDCEARRPAR